MGQQNTTPTLDHYAENYDLVQFINCQPYGYSKILRNRSTRAAIAQITIESYNKHEQLQMIQKISKMLKELNHQFILELVNWCEEDTSFIFGQYSKISLFYQYCPTNLEKMIMERQMSGIHFLETEIVYLLYALVSAGHWLNQNQTAHKDIKPRNILITEKSQIKLAPVGSFPFDYDAFKKRNNFNEYTYLPPEQDFTWQKVDLFFTYRNQCDVYASGLTLLDAMSLNFSYDIIETKDISLIDDRLVSLKNYYSRELILIVRKMLNEKDTRITFDHLYMKLYPFEKNIMNLEYIELPLLEKKLHRSFLSQPHIAINQQPQQYYIRPAISSQYERISLSPISRIVKPEFPSVLITPQPQVVLKNQSQLEFLHEQIFKVLESRKTKQKYDSIFIDDQEQVKSTFCKIHNITLIAHHEAKLVKVQNSKIKFFPSPLKSTTTTSTPQSVSLSPQ